MKEDFLHYLWRYKKLDYSNLYTTNNEKLSIIKVGDYTQQAGPDFFNAQILIENQKWAGNIEIHVNSSDWYLHHHECDSNYENVILHVVWEHDCAVFRKDNSEIPVLELKNLVSTSLLNQYKQLKSSKTWINCEKEIRLIPQFLFQNWQERLFFERLERKSNPIELFLSESKNDWETALFCFLSKNFGLNSNGESFFRMAKLLPFSIIRKESNEIENIEALFYGQASMLNEVKEDTYYQDLKKRWEYLKNKYQLQTCYIEPIQFFKLRPDNFPTIRLSQLASLYYTHQNLFSKVISVASVNEIYDIFSVSSSEYWQNHYHFDKQSPRKNRLLSNSFIDLLIINTIIPFKYAYEKSLGKDTSEKNIQYLEQIKPESNSVIKKFNHFGIHTKNAFQTQALLQLKNEYCDKNRCLECAIGIELLKN
jgi:hypothetical protein